MREMARILMVCVSYHLTKHVLLYNASEVSGDLNEVPGIGPVAEDKLAAAGITNTFQLIGKFLTLKEDDDVAKHMDEFVSYLKSVVCVPSPLPLPHAHESFRACCGNL